jgi:hypothetical protein
LYGEKVLSAKAKAKMFKQYAGSGYGWYLGKKYDKDYIYMNGRSPGFSSHISRYPSEELCVIVLENNYVSVANQIGMDLAGIVFSQVIETPELTMLKFKKEESDLIVGKYQFGPDFYQANFLMTITDKDGYLFSDWGELIPGKPNQFIQRAFWSKVIFNKTDGKISSMTFDNFLGKKIN